MWQGKTSNNFSLRKHLLRHNVQGVFPDVFGKTFIVRMPLGKDFVTTGKYNSQAEAHKKFKLYNSIIMARESYQSKIRKKLQDMELNEEIDKSKFIKELYGSEDYYIKRSFDAMLCKIKKELKDQYSKEFQSQYGNVIIRIN